MVISMTRPSPLGATMRASIKAETLTDCSYAMKCKEAN